VHEATPEATSVSRAEARGSIALWFGILAGPAAWGLQVLLGYGVEEIACSPASQSERLVGISTVTWIVVVHIVLTAVTTAALLVSFVCWRRTAAGDSSPGSRAGWMATAGIMVSALFLVVILSGFMPSIFLGTCEFSP
jgi:hypothetical protein